jgi:hypothetical protein
MTATQQKLSNGFNVFGLPDDPEAGTFRTCTYAAEILRQINDAPKFTPDTEKKMLAPPALNA